MSISSPPAGSTTADSKSTASVTPLRTVSPRKALPGARAITGGLLVVVAAIGAYVAATGAAGDHRSPVVVAVHDLPAGSRLSPGDLKVVRMQLTTDASAHVATAAARLSGATTLGPIKAGEIVQTGAIEMKASGAAQPEISISIPSARALGGSLRSGDRVDVITTDKSNNSTTRIAVSNALVVSVDQASSSLGKDGDLTVRFAVDSRDQATAIAAANDSGSVTLVRTTGLDS